MPKKAEWEKPGQQIMTVQTGGDVEVPPPNGGFVGRFLTEAENTFKARAMRMTGLMRRINESGQRTEALLRVAAERMEAAEARVLDNLHREGLVAEEPSEVTAQNGE